jgi:hypothetical protein
MILIVLAVSSLYVRKNIHPLDTAEFYAGCQGLLGAKGL